MIVLATNHGVIFARLDDEWRIGEGGLEGKRVTCVSSRGGKLLAGTGDGVFRSDDGGRTWSEASQGLSTSYVRWLAHHPDRADLVFVGTEPAGIFISQDGGSTWQERPEVARLRDKHGWFLPYSPRAGCVRGFALQGEQGYAAVEVGGVLRSDDQGMTWKLAQGSDGNPDFRSPADQNIHPDLHSIEVHPSSSDLVFAPTGGGFYRSRDGGKSWELLYDCYCRAVWVDPGDENHIVLGPADGVDRNGRIEETWDGGETWKDASAGLETPWPRHMVERFTQVGEELFAVLSNGQLHSARFSQLEWGEVLPETGGVNAVVEVK